MVPGLSAEVEFGRLIRLLFGLGSRSVIGTWGRQMSPPSALKLVCLQIMLFRVHFLQTCAITVIETDPSDLNVKLQLAEVYDELGRREEALDLVNQGT